MFQKVAQIPVMADPKRLYNDVDALVKWFRNPEHMDQLNQSADYIRKQWESMGLKVTEQTFEYSKKTFRNLMVSIGPQDAPRFVVGAHYDVVHDQPGADDNASGVAGMLELSRLLLANQPKLKSRIDLVAYTLEEAPYMTLGSKKHVESLVKDKVPVKGMVSLEMIGYFSDKPKSQHFPSKMMQYFYPDTGNFIATVGYGRSLGLLWKAKRAFKQFSTLPSKMLYSPVNAFGLDRSDHRYFTEAGIPAFMITDTSNHRNPHYHQKSDTIYTLDFTRMAEVVKGVYGLVTKI